MRHRFYRARFFLPILLLTSAFALGSCDEDPVAPEGTVENPWLVDLNRADWVYASLPAEYADEPHERRFGLEDRALSRWHPSVPGVTRGEIEPLSSEGARRELLAALTVRALSLDESQWSETSYAGVQRAFPAPLDLRQATHLEFWLDDGAVAAYGNPPQPRVGRLHVDLGHLNEDWFWRPQPDGSFELGRWDSEDLDGDGALQVSEDVGLDGRVSAEEPADLPSIAGRPGRAGDPAGDDFFADLTSDAFDYPGLQGTEGNQRLDTEDIDHDGVFDLRDGYFTFGFDLDDDEVVAVDALRDFAASSDFVAASLEAGRAWRKIRLDLAAFETRRARPDDGLPYQAVTPLWNRVQAIRLWYAAPTGTRAQVALRLAGMQFVGPDGAVGSSP